jgi:hypothetical protein
MLSLIFKETDLTEGLKYSAPAVELLVDNLTTCVNFMRLCVLRRNPHVDDFRSGVSLQCGEQAPVDSTMLQDDSRRILMLDTDTQSTLYQKRISEQDVS